MPVVCQLRQAVTFPFRTSILSARVQCSTRTSPITDIWLSFSFSYSHSVKKLRVWHLTKFLLFLFTSREILLKNWRLHSYFESIPHRLPFFECIIFWCENLDLVMIMVLCAELPRVKSTLNTFQFQCCLMKAPPSQLAPGSTLPNCNKRSSHRTVGQTPHRKQHFGGAVCSLWPPEVQSATWIYCPSV